MGRLKTGPARRHRIQPVEGPVLDPCKECVLKRGQKVTPLKSKEVPLEGSSFDPFLPRGLPRDLPPSPKVYCSNFHCLEFVSFFFLLEACLEAILCARCGLKFSEAALQDQPCLNPCQYLVRPRRGPFLPQLASDRPHLTKKKPTRQNRP